MFVTRLSINATGSLQPVRTAATPSEEVSAAPQLDEFRPGGASDGNSLWAELRQAGLLASAGAISGPVGATLTETVRQGLLEALCDLHRSGVEFTRKRGFRLPGQSERVTLTPEQTLAHLERPTGKEYLQTTPGSERPRRLEKVADLQGLHEFLGSPSDPIVEAVKSLAEHKIIDGPAGHYCGYRGGQKVSAWVEEPTIYSAYGVGEPEVRRFDAGTPDEILAMDFFAGSGRDRGLADGDRAAGLQRLAQRGLVDSWDAYEAYQKNPDWIAVGPRSDDRKALPPFLIPRSDLEETDGVETSYKRYDSAFRRYLAPAIGALGHVMNPRGLPTRLLAATGPFTVECRMATYASLMNSLRMAGTSSNQIYSDALKLYDALMEGSRSPYEVFYRLQAITPSLGGDGIDSAFKQLAELKLAQPWRDDDERPRVFGALFEATGSLEVASTGTNLVRLPLGSESLDQRLEFFLQIARTLPEEAREATPGLYQEALILRHQDRSLGESTGRFTAVLRGCVALRQPALATPIYELVQKSEAEEADRAVAEFLRRAATLQVGDALGALRPLAEPGAIEVEDHQVNINGIRLPIRGRS